jgi:hypothetical protein
MKKILETILCEPTAVLKFLKMLTNLFKNIGINVTSSYYELVGIPKLENTILCTKFKQEEVKAKCPLQNLVE